MVSIYGMKSFKWMSYCLPFDPMLKFADKNGSPVLGCSPVPAELSPALNLHFLTAAFTFKNTFWLHLSWLWHCFPITAMHLWDEKKKFFKLLSHSHTEGSQWKPQVQEAFSWKHFVQRKAAINTPGCHSLPFILHCTHMFSQMGSSLAIPLLHGCVMCLEIYWYPTLLPYRVEDGQDGCIILYGGIQELITES